MNRTSCIIVLSALLFPWCGPLPPAVAQSALERLEQQIRQRVGAPTTRQPDAGNPPAAPPTETPRGSGRAEPAYLGVVVDDQKDRGRGVRISELSRGSPAERAGLQRQDLITALAGIRVRQLSDMSDILAMFGPGEAVDFDVLREGKQQKVRVVLGQRVAAAEPSPSLPETVPLPPGQAIPPPPEPQPNGPQLQPAKTADQPPPDASRIEQLQRRVNELERRVAELERAMAKVRKRGQ